MSWSESKVVCRSAQAEVPTLTLTLVMHLQRYDVTLISPRNYFL